MSRTKGARDRKPRRMVNPFPRRSPGHGSRALRIYAPTVSLRWFASLHPGLRGELVQMCYEVHQQEENPSP